MKRRERRSGLPGFGWSPRFSGLERPTQWLGFALTAVAVIVIAMLSAYLAFG